MSQRTSHHDRIETERITGSGAGIALRGNLLLGLLVLVLLITNGGAG